MSRIFAATICAVAFVCICRTVASWLSIDYHDFMFGALAFMHFHLTILCVEKGGAK